MGNDERTVASPGEAFVIDGENREGLDCNRIGAAK